MRRIRSRLRGLMNLRVIDSSRLYEQWERRHLQKLLAHLDVDCVFDVGANYGQYARMLRTKAGFKGLIISFEPIPDAARALRASAAHDPRWVIEEVALGSRDGEQEFNIMKGSQFSSLSQPRHDQTSLFEKANRVERTVKVRTETLTSAYQRMQAAHGFERPFLKLDTQGYDSEIVRSARETMRHFVGLQSELAIKKLYQHSVDYREALDLFEACGFSLSAFVPNNAGHFPLLVETDCIMVRSDLISDLQSPGLSTQPGPATQA